MDLSEAEKQYRETLRPLCEGFAKRLESLLDELLRSSNMSIAQLEHRAKTVEGLCDKFERKEYKNPTDMKDMCGIRVITYYQDDVAKVVSLIHTEFSVDNDNSLDKAIELDVDEFGYRSFHLVVSLNEPRKNLKEWQAYRELPAEIQVRSVLQHGWAAISHKLDYKKASQAPEQLRRKLFRLSALLELADEEFVDIRDSSKEIVKGYEADLDRGSLDIPLDLDSLRAFLKEKGKLDHWMSLGKQAGLAPYAYPSDLGERDPAAIERLLTALRTTGVKTIRELEQVLLIPDVRILHALKLYVSLRSNVEAVSTWAAIDILYLVIFVERYKEVSDSFGWEGFGPNYTKTMKKVLKFLHDNQSANTMPGDL